MHEQLSDRIARILGRDLPRRRAIALVVGLLAGSGAAGDVASAAPRATCRAQGASCTRRSQCCSNACPTGRNAPRSLRNRCACAPQCIDRVCGDDGCGGSCGSCGAGLLCTPDGSACEAPCVGYDPAGPADYCVGTPAGERVAGYSAVGWFEPWTAPGSPAGTTCDGDAACQLGPICEHPDFRCVCKHSWRFDPDPTPATAITNQCIAVRVTPPACTATGFGAYSACATTATGEEFGFTSFLSNGYDGHNDFCASDAECVSKDADCQLGGNRCYCGIASWYGSNPSGISQFDVGAGCQMVSM